MVNLPYNNVYNYGINLFYEIFPAMKNVCEMKMLSKTLYSKIKADTEKNTHKTSLMEITEWVWISKLNYWNSVDLS